MHLPLSLILQDGFDYAAFSAAIHADESLSDSIKQAAIFSFNPHRELAMNALSPEDALPELSSPFIHKPHGGQPVPQHHPVQALWQDAWQKALVFYAPEVVHYDLVTRQTDKQDYPHVAPEIRYTEAGQHHFAAISMDSRPTLIVSDGFLQLPINQQSAILVHEANHAFEPVMQGVTIEKCRSSRSIFRSKRNEYRADNLTEAWGEGDALAQALQTLTKQADSNNAAFSSVCEKLHQAGYAIDPDKFSTAVLHKRRDLNPEPNHKPLWDERCWKARDLRKERRELFRIAGKYNRQIQGYFPPSEHPDTPSRVARLTDKAGRSYRQR